MITRVRGTPARDDGRRAEDIKPASPRQVQLFCTLLSAGKSEGTSDSTSSPLHFLPRDLSCGGQLNTQARPFPVLNPSLYS